MTSTERQRRHEQCEAEMVPLISKVELALDGKGFHDLTRFQGQYDKSVTFKLYAEKVRVVIFTHETGAGFSRRPTGHPAIKVWSSGGYGDTQTTVFAMKEDGTYNIAGAVQRAVDEVESRKAQDEVADKKRATAKASQLSQTEEFFRVGIDPDILFIKSVGLTRNADGSYALRLPAINVSLDRAAEILKQHGII